MKEGLQRAIEVLQDDYEEHYNYEGEALQEGMLHAIELLEEELERDE